MTLKSKTTKLISIILTIFLLSAITTPVSADTTILTHKDKSNLDISDYFLPIKDFDMIPYLTPSINQKHNPIVDASLLKKRFRDDTCWESLNAKTQSYVYKTISPSLKLQASKPTDENRDSICNTLKNCNLDKKGWVGTESLTSGTLHLTYDNTQPSKISIKMNYNPKKIKLYDTMYPFEMYNKPNEMILLNQTFDLNNLSDNERKLIDLIVNIIDTGNQNNTGMLILATTATGAGTISTIITCAGTIPTLGLTSIPCGVSVAITSFGIASTLDSISNHHQNEMIVNKYKEQLKAFNDITTKDEL